MMKKKLWTSSAASLLILLSGCGGEDSSNGSPNNPPVGATPTPTSTASIYPPAPFGIVAAQDFFLIGWRPTPDGPVPLETGTYQIGWGRDPDTYRISTPQIQDGRLAYTFPGNNSVGFTIYRPDGTETSLHATVKPAWAYDAASQSIWYVQVSNIVGDSVSELASGLFGLETPSAKVPTAGQRVYQFDRFNPQSKITIDFATRQVTGQVPVFYSDWAGTFPPTFHDIEDGIFDPVTGEFTGKFTVPNAQTEGVVRGRLMGSDAGELAIAYAGPVFDPYSYIYFQSPFLAAGKYCQSC